MKYKEWKVVSEIRRAYPEAKKLLTKEEWKTIANWMMSNELNFRSVEVLDSFEKVEQTIFWRLKELSSKNYGWKVEKSLLVTGDIPLDFQADDGYGQFGSLDDAEINQRVVILSQSGDIFVYQPDIESIAQAEFDLSLL